MSEIKKTLNMFKGDFPMKADLAKHEPEYIARWEKEDLYNRMGLQREGSQDFYLHDGPPYANGDIHCGHALNKIIKDVINRYKALKGYHVVYVPGWDTHGLPIENAVTKSGVDRKSMSVADFRRLCMKYAYKQQEKQAKQFKRLGVLGDFEHPYLTLTKDYEAEEIGVFADMALKGYIYKGLKPVAWSPSSECALAEAEIEYHDDPAKTIYVRFKVTDGKGKLPEGSYFVIWTTTPWTIPANTSICLNPKMEYGLYKTDKGELVFAEALKDKLVSVLDLKECAEEKKFLGSELEYVETKHPLYDRVSLVINGDHVTAEDGTGCVHTAGGHGEDDYKVSVKYGLPLLNYVDDRGYMTEGIGERLKGMFYADANDEVVKMLAEDGALMKEVDIVHSYPHDWRTHQPIIYRATPQWFCSISSFKQQILNEIEKISFEPSWGKVRLRNMVAMREDWCISRQRAWGVPIPIIYCEDKTPIIDKEVFKHIQDLVRQYGSNVWFEREARDLLPEGYSNPHSPHGLFTKEKDIMDVWFDSGTSWLSSDIERGNKYPADLYFEGSDQYRGWYNSSITLAVATGHGTPCKSILTHGFIVDQNGQKFSKSLGNGIAPEDIYNVYGADILRLWTASIDFTMAEIKLSDDLIKSVSESYRKIRNTFKFLLSSLFDAPDRKYDPKASYEFSEIDKMILNKLYDVVKKADAEYADYDFLGVTTLVENFMINDLSSFYLDYAKDILYCDDVNSLRRKGVQHVMHELAKELSIVLEPILPFTAEEINDHMPDPVPTSIALADYPLHDVDADELALYDALLSVRAKSFKALEEKRSKGELSVNGEGEVYYSSKDAKEKGAVEKVGSELMAKALIVSKFAFVSSEQDAVEVKKSQGVKCDRCWNYVDVSEITEENGVHVCARCREVLAHRCQD